MKKGLKNLCLAALCLSFGMGNAQAQSYEELVGMFSQTTPGGTARYLGIGGAQTALGGEASFTTNPAGLGMFNRSAFSFSPGFTFANTENQYFPGPNSQPTISPASTTRFQMPQIGVVFNHSKSDDAPGVFRGGSFGITLTKVNDFNNRTSYQGKNMHSSIIDSFLDNAFGYTPDQLWGITQLAYDNYLIGERSILGPDEPSDDYFTDVGGVPLQSEIIETRGAQYQWNIGYGANISDIFFLGASLNINTVRFTSNKIFRESNYTVPNNPGYSSPLHSMQLHEDLLVRGTGVSLSIGAIVRPVDFFQVGLGLTTPTSYRISDDYEAFMSTRWNNFDYYGDGSVILQNESARSNIFISEYTLTTPLRINAGAALFLGKQGFITGDIELLDYSTGKIQSRDLDENFHNQNIRNMYQNAMNIRLGAEFRADIFRFRGGFAHMGDAFNVDDGVNRSRRIFSLGAGIRMRDYFIDLAVNSTRFNSTYVPYIMEFGAPLDDPYVNISNRLNMAVITVGFNF
jgi:hypothetical protein